MIRTITDNNLYFDHIGIAVSNTEAAMKKYVEGMGAKIIFYKKKDDLWHFYWTQIEYGGLKLEFMEPFDEGFLRKFIEKRGEGVHHITFHVSNLAGTIADLEKKGLNVVDRRRKRKVQDSLSFSEGHPWCTDTIYRRSSIVS